MRRPWFEAAAALAAAHHRLALAPPTFSQGVPYMRIDSATFALVRGPNDDKPLAFTAIRGLARRIHGARQGHGIELEEQTLRLQGEQADRTMVGVYVLGLDGGRQALLGYAWAGQGQYPRERLQAALDAQAVPIYGQSREAA